MLYIGDEIISVIAGTPPYSESPNEGFLDDRILGFFWKLIYDKVNIIVKLCELGETQKNCPDYAREFKQVGIIVQKDKEPYYNKNGIKIFNLIIEKKTEGKDEEKDKDKNSKRTVKYLEFSNWHDNNVIIPAKATELLEIVNILRTNSNQIANLSTYFHCVAGLGRTGTLIVMLMVFLEFQRKQQNDDYAYEIYKWTLLTRSQRYSAILNSEQYSSIFTFLCFLINHYAEFKNKNKIYLEEVMTGKRGDIKKVN